MCKRRNVSDRKTCVRHGRHQPGSGRASATIRDNDGATAGQRLVGHKPPGFMLRREHKAIGCRVGPRHLALVQKIPPCAARSRAIERKRATHPPFHRTRPTRTRISTPLSRSRQAARIRSMGRLPACSFPANRTTFASGGMASRLRSRWPAAGVARDEKKSRIHRMGR